jgi:hypothetical protein
MTSAYFLGDAPSTLDIGLFAYAAPGFTVYFVNGKTGFAAPPGPWLPTGNPAGGSYTTAYFTPAPPTPVPASSPWSLALVGIVGTALAAVALRKQRAVGPQG